MGFRLSFIISLILLSCSTIFAQWSVVAPNLLEVIPATSGGFGSIAFKDGVLWVGRTAIWKSLDSGITWTQARPSFDGVITEIKFFDKNTGVVATGAGVFLTTDQGQTWSNILHHSAYGASFAGSKQNIVAACDGSGFFYSTDGGASWNSQNPAAHLLCILGRSDGTACGFGGSDATASGNLYTTRDFGVTWHGTAATDYDSFCLAEDSCDNTIYRMNEEGHINTNNAAQFYSTLDNGATWISRTSHNGRYYCAAIAVSPHAVFCSTLSNGIDRSTDQGTTWANIGGPSNNIDTRLLAAINDNIIIAADGNGSIFRTINSGGFPFSAAFINSTPTFLIPQISISSCTSYISSTLASLKNCRHLIIQSADIQGSDINHFFLVPKTFPYDLSARGIDSFYITFDPTHQVGVFHINLHVTGTYPATGLPFDTVIVITAVSKATPPDLIADKPLLDYKTLSSCDPAKDSVFILKNNGCDTLTIISGPGNVDPSFIVDSLPLPFVLRPGGSVVIHVHCKSHGQGQVSTFATYRAIQQGIQQDVQVQLQFFGLQGQNKLFLQSNKINFNPLSSCSADSTQRFFVNPGCDTLVIDSTEIFGDPDFLTQLGPFPIILPPGDTIRFPVYFDPLSKGAKKAIIRILGHDIYGNTRIIDTSITVSGVVKNSSVSFYAPSAQVNFGTVSFCRSDSLARFFVNSGCDTLVIDSAALSGDFDFLAGLGPFPIILAPGDTAKYAIYLNPVSKGTKTAAIKISGHDIDKNLSTIDTTIGISGIVGNGSAVLSIASMSVNFDSLSPCSQMDTLLHLRNSGCDTLFILPTKISGDSDFSFSPVSQMIIPPGDSATIDIKLIPQKSGAKNAQIHLLIGSAPNRRDTVITLSGIIGDDLRKFSLSLSGYYFDSTSICQIKDTVLTLKNTGCDSLEVTSAYLVGDPDFILNKTDSSLASGESTTYKITLSPQQPGLRQSQLHLTIGSGTNKLDTTLDFRGFIVRGSTILSSSVASCDFGTTTICDERDTEITLHNSGCDTLTVTAVSGLIAGFRTNTTFPILILPGKDTTVNIHTQIDTSNQQRSNSTIVTFLSNSDPPLPPIPLSRKIQYPAIAKFNLIPEQKENSSSDIAVFKLKPDAPLLPGITTLDFALTYNTDLLAYLSSMGPNVVTLSNNTLFHITGNPFITADTDGSVATLQFKVYLTTDSTTDLAIADLHLNSSDPKFEQCTATAIADSTAFHYQYLCGQRSIAALLRGNGSIIITSIRPNPAQDYLEVNLLSALSQDVHLEIVNLLGAAEITDNQSLHKGQNIISYRIPTLAGGLYFIRAKSPSGTATQSFIRMK